jgi:hypothetical protein
LLAGVIASCGTSSLIGMGRIHSWIFLFVGALRLGDFQLLLVRKCGAACLLGWAVFFIPGGLCFLLILHGRQVGGRCWSTSPSVVVPCVVGRVSLHWRLLSHLNQQQNSHCISRPSYQRVGTDWRHFFIAD